MDESSDDSVSRLLDAVQSGDRSALDELYALVYGELRILAHRQRRRWDASGMLNTTALVHEAYLKLVKQRHIHLETRAHFFALAATAIRHIVSNYARDRQAGKRGSGVRTVSLSELGSRPGGELRVSDAHADLLVAIDEALDRSGARQSSTARASSNAGSSVVYRSRRPPPQLGFLHEQ